MKRNNFVLPNSDNDEIQLHFQASHTVQCCFALLKAVKALNVFFVSHTSVPPAVVLDNGRES